MLKKTNQNLAKTIQEWRKKPVSLLVLAGRRKTGKDVLVEYIMKKYPFFKHYRIAEAPNLIAKILELPLDRKIQQVLFGVNKILYPILGEAAFKRRVAIILDREKPKFAIVEAVRTKEEYEEFVRRRHGFLIGIVADDEIRYQRALVDAKNAKKKEKRDEGKMSFAEFIEKERLPIERDIAWILQRADVLLDNNYKSKGLFYAAIDHLMMRLGIDGSKKNKT